jgi:hypothetical protein
LNNNIKSNRLSCPPSLLRAMGDGCTKLYGLLVPLGYDITAFTPMAYQRGSLPRSFKEISSCGGFRAYMLSALIPSQRSYPAMLLAEQLVHQRLVQSGPLVLGSDPLKFLTPTVDRDRTVSRRSEPSSRATLMGEQPNPWDLLQPQDVTSRHRGAKPPRRCELLGEISLLSPAYLLSFERWPFHAEPPDHYALLSYLIDLYVSQSSSLLPLHSTHGYQAC